MTTARNFFANPLVLSGLVAIMVLGGNYALGLGGVNQKVSCTVESSAAVAAAVLAASSSLSHAIGN